MALVSGIVLLSAGVGYMTAMKRHTDLNLANLWTTTEIRRADKIGLDVQNVGIIDRDAFPDAAQWGELQAQIIKLKVLFKRLALVGELDDPEFHLDIVLGNNANLQQLSPLEAHDSMASLRFELANQAVTHMTNRSVALLSIYQQRQQEHRLALSGTPTQGGVITSPFGYRTDPRNGRRQLHNGVDYSGEPGSAVLALADGVVTYSGKNGGYGNLVELEHADGYRSRYAHNEFNLVRVGRYVSKGQAIATMGSTGRSTGTHVHVEVRHHAKAVDPQLFIR